MELVYQHPAGILCVGEKTNFPRQLYWLIGGRATRGPFQWTLMIMVKDVPKLRRCRCSTFPFRCLSPGTTMWRWRIRLRRQLWGAGVVRSLRRLRTLPKATSSGSTSSLMSISPQSRDSACATPSRLRYVHYPKLPVISNIWAHKASMFFLSVLLTHSKGFNRMSKKESTKQNVSANQSNFS